jgi:hypothetical protein
LAHPLSHLFNKSIETGKARMIWFYSTASINSVLNLHSFNILYYLNFARSSCPFCFWMATANFLLLPMFNSPNEGHSPLQVQIRTSDRGEGVSLKVRLCQHNRNVLGYFS